MIGCLIWRKNVSNKKTSTITDGIICLSITRAQNSRQQERMETSRSEPTVSKTLEKVGHSSGSCIIDTIAQKYMSRISGKHYF